MKVHPVKVSEKDRMAIADLEKRISNIEETIKALIEYNILKSKEEQAYIKSNIESLRIRMY